MDKKNRKKWTGEQKLEVLNYCKQEGVGRTSREYGISTTIIYQWQRKFEMGGIDELEGKKTKDRDSRLYELERENRELKAIVAEKEMQIRSAERSNKKNQLLNWKER